MFRTFTYDEETVLISSTRRQSGRHTTKDKATIYNVQRSSLFAEKKLNYSARLKRLGLPTIEYRRERTDLIQTYKILNDINRLDTDKIFKRAQYTQTRGHNFKLFKQRSRLNLRANCFSNRVVNVWNSLPENVVNSPSIRQTCPCKVYPLKPHFYIAKLGYAGLYLFFLIFAPKHRLWVPVRTASARRF